MGTLQDGLLKTGIASERQFHEAEATAMLQSEMVNAQNLRSVKEKDKRLGILRETSSPDTFRRESRKLLLQYPELAQELINIAHAQGMHNKKGKGGGRLIANLYQVKETVQKGSLSVEAKKTAIDKLFPNK